MMRLMFDAGVRVGELTGLLRPAVSPTHVKVNGKRVLRERWAVGERPRLAVGIGEAAVCPCREVAVSPPARLPEERIQAMSDAMQKRVRKAIRVRDRLLSRPGLSGDLLLPSRNTGLRPDQSGVPGVGIGTRGPCRSSVSDPVHSASAEHAEPETALGAQDGLPTPP